ncbi:hypothetical protein B296_00048496 [Ensete ventricosum]|uniref:Uncharacterized protein n=1 Tax=Ensete ventricosum TaxID=4639 RepID=A0A426YUI9_ENSVE|nr:hypothetical protein B296_00048496 [Ensete ventricosum]
MCTARYRDNLGTLVWIGVTVQLTGFCSKQDSLEGEPLSTILKLLICILSDHPGLWKRLSSHRAEPADAVLAGDLCIVLCIFV